MREAKVECPCCHYKFVVRDTTGDATDVKAAGVWSAFDEIFKAMDDGFRKLSRALSRK